MLSLPRAISPSVELNEMRGVGQSRDVLKLKSGESALGTMVTLACSHAMAEKLDLNVRVSERQHLPGTWVIEGLEDYTVVIFFSGQGAEERAIYYASNRYARVQIDRCVTGQRQS